MFWITESWRSRVGLILSTPIFSLKIKNCSFFLLHYFIYFKFFIYIFREGNIYAKITLDCTKMLAWIAQKREKTGSHITITHVIGKLMGVCLRKAPGRRLISNWSSQCYWCRSLGLNGRICFGRFINYSTCDISFLVVLPVWKTWTFKYTSDLLNSLIYSLN